MNAQLQMILVGMLVDFTRKEVLEKEIIFGAKTGIQKLEAVKNNFFAKFKDFVRKAQERNNPYIPDDIEVTETDPDEIDFDDLSEIPVIRKPKKK